MDSRPTSAAKEIYAARTAPYFRISDLSKSAEEARLDPLLSTASSNGSAPARARSSERHACRATTSSATIMPPTAR